MTCRTCGTSLIEEEFARLCPRRDGSEDGQWHDYFEKERSGWADLTPAKPLDKFAALEARLAEVEKRMGPKR